MHSEQSELSEHSGSLRSLGSGPASQAQSWRNPIPSDAAFIIISADPSMSIDELLGILFHDRSLHR
jgi:hypothetical protein